MSTITRETVEALLPQLRDELSRYIQLPEKGLIAGQAPASIIYRLLGLNISGPVNDIDLFVTKDDYCSFHKPIVSSLSQERYNQIKLRAKLGDSDFAPAPANGAHQHPFVRTAPTLFSTGKATIEPDCSGQVMNSIIKGSYSVHRSYTAGILNVVVITAFRRDLSHRRLCQNIIQSFDFNCCSVGIDLQEDRIYLTDEFLDFVNTAQLRVQAVHTPIHSMIRLMKKFKQDLNGVYCDIKQELDTLKSASVFALTYRENRSSVKQHFPYDYYKEKSAEQRRKDAFEATPMMFGKKYKALYERFQEYLPDIRCVPVNYIDHSGQAQGLFTLSFSYSDIRLATYRNRVINSLKSLDIDIKMVQAVYVMLYHITNNTPRISRSTRTDARARLDKLTQMFNDSGMDLYHAHGQNRNYACISMLSYLLTNFDNQRDKSISVDAWQKALKHLQTHVILLGQIASLPFDRQIQAIAYFVHCQKTGRWDVIGQAENEFNFSNLVFDIHNIPAPELLNSPVPVIAPTLGIGRLKTPWFTIQELRSKHDYAIAGSSQRHCLSGYFSDIHRSRVYAIKTRHGLSHIHLLNPWAIFGPCDRITLQHRAFANTIPHPANIRIGQGLSFVFKGIFKARWFRYVTLAKAKNWTVNIRSKSKNDVPVEIFEDERAIPF